MNGDPKPCLLDSTLNLQSYLSPALRTALSGEDLIQACHLPTKLNELRSTVTITPELLRQVADSTNLIQTGPRKLTHDEIYDILMECLD